ncbi:MAG: hypothetical protein LBD90_07840 [Bifidobacteriaceae bacterium]|nr:hypothetical protein [Bifidobacteriaceae bacterium]
MAAAGPPHVDVDDIPPETGPVGTSMFACGHLAHHDPTWAGSLVAPKASRR